MGGPDIFMDPEFARIVAYFAAHQITLFIPPIHPTPLKINIKLTDIGNLSAPMHGGRQIARRLRSRGEPRALHFSISGYEIIPSTNSAIKNRAANADCPNASGEGELHGKALASLH